MTTPYSRSRERTNSLELSEWQSWRILTNNLAADPVTTPPTLYTTGYDHEAMSDEVTPSYLHRMKSGDVICNPMTKTTTRVIGSTGSLRFDCRYSSDGNLPITVKHEMKPLQWAYGQEQIISADWSHIPAPEWGTRGNQALLNAMAKASSAEMQTLVTLAEFKKTLSLLSTLGKRFLYLANDHRMISALGRGIKNTSRSWSKSKAKALTRMAQKQSKQVANEWLQYRYGIRQLFFDLESSIKGWDRYRSEERTRFTSSIDAPSYEDERSSVSTWNHSFNKTVTRKVTDTGSVSAGVLVQPRISGLSRLNDAFGVTQVLPTMWELTRFSWVIDRFVNISKIIGAYELHLHKQILASWIVYRTHTTKTLIDLTELKDSSEVWQIIGGSYNGYKAYKPSCWLSGDVTMTATESTDTVQRVANPQVVYLPSVNLRIDTSFLADLAALIRTAFQR